MLAFVHRRRMLVLGAALGLICVIGVGWYFASRRTNTGPSVTQTNTGSPVTQTALAPEKLTAGKTKVNPKDHLRYVWIPPGKFMMGCSPGDSECEFDEKPAHEVNIGRGFWIGQTPVTQAAYMAVTGKPNPSNFKGGDLPVERVTSEEAGSYCDAVGMRLLTEAEWEYAARAGTTGARYGDLDQVAWYKGNSGEKTHPVAQKTANPWGLYDMLGNVWEWCSDWYGTYSASKQHDPTGPSSGQFGEFKVQRGGSWLSNPRDVRVSSRIRFEPAYRNLNIGFRCGGELP
jgi:formylglycine-generating enzyme required for sulfatase activity